MKYDENTWKPESESGPCRAIDFDRNFPIDRTFMIHGCLVTTRIRFVFHPDCEPGKIRVFKFSMLNLFKKSIGKRLEKFKGDFIHKFLTWSSQFRIWNSEEQLTADEIEKKYGYSILS